MMLRHEYPQLVAKADRAAAEKVAAAVVDPNEFLWSIRNQERFDVDFKSTPGGKVACHAPCHLRAQAIGFRGRDLLQKIPGVQPVLVQECCGHDGTFAMTVSGFEPSQRIGRKAFDEMKESGAEVWATECPLAALQFQQHAGVKPLHPLSILARAYRPDGFAIPVEKKG
jgi:glycerol-3-phosphate dehydrogenase subunit C